MRLFLMLLSYDFAQIEYFDSIKFFANIPCLNGFSPNKLHESRITSRMAPRFWFCFVVCFVLFLFFQVKYALLIG